MLTDRSNDGNFFCDCSLVSQWANPRSLLRPSGNWRMKQWLHIGSLTDKAEIVVEASSARSICQHGRALTNSQIVKVLWGFIKWHYWSLARPAQWLPWKICVLVDHGCGADTLPENQMSAGHRSDIDVVCCLIDAQLIPWFSSRVSVRHSCLIVTQWYAAFCIHAITGWQGISSTPVQQITAWRTDLKNL